MKVSYADPVTTTGLSTAAIYADAAGVSAAYAVFARYGSNGFPEMYETVEQWLARSDLPVPEPVRAPLRASLQDVALAVDWLYHAADREIIGKTAGEYIHRSALGELASALDSMRILAGQSRQYTPEPPAAPEPPDLGPPPSAEPTTTAAQLSLAFESRYGIWFGLRAIGRTFCPTIGVADSMTPNARTDLIWFIETLQAGVPREGAVIEWDDEGVIFALAVLPRANGLVRFLMCDASDLQDLGEEVAEPYLDEVVEARALGLALYRAWRAYARTTGPEHVEYTRRAYDEVAAALGLPDWRAVAAMTFEEVSVAAKAVVAARGDDAAVEGVAEVDARSRRIHVGSVEQLFWRGEMYDQRHWTSDVLEGLDELAEPKPRRG